LFNALRWRLCGRPRAGIGLRLQGVGWIKALAILFGSNKGRTVQKDERYEQSICRECRERLSESANHTEVAVLCRQCVSLK